MSAGYTSPLAASLAEGLLERFQRYVRIDTQSQREATGSPSTPGQLELGRLLVAELHELGLTDATLDGNGYVVASLPAGLEGPAGEPGGSAGTGDGTGAAIGLIAHLDTSPDAPAAGVQPLVHRDYDGGVIELPRGGTRLDPETMPDLRDKRGHDIVSSSGDTLLGADDKAGVAAIMTAVSHLVAHPELPRAPLRIAFTPDEEIGALAGHLDLDAFGVRCAYTIDGGELGELEDESFSAVEVVIGIDGVDVHPGYATGKMVSALRLAAKIVSSLPSDRLTPDTTADREGFIHPYSLTGTAARAEVRTIVRDHDEDKLSAHVELLDGIAHAVVQEAPRARMQIDVRRQYRNMRQFIERDPDVITAAEEALRAEGIEPLRRPIRGGTDGSSLSERGLPTPNLFTGGHDWHSVREWASLQDMAAATATLVRLAGVWSQRRPGGDGDGGRVY